MKAGTSRNVDLPEALGPTSTSNGRTSCETWRKLR